MNSEQQLLGISSGSGKVLENGKAFQKYHPCNKLVDFHPSNCLTGVISLILSLSLSSPCMHLCRYDYVYYYYIYIYISHIIFQATYVCSLRKYNTSTIEQPQIAHMAKFIANYVHNDFTKIFTCTTYLYLII